jgi:hypothetical protein
MSEWTRAAIAAAAISWALCPAGAAVVVQVDPDESLAEANWVVIAEANYIKLDLTKHFKSPEMLDTPIKLKITLEANDVGKPLWIVHGTGGEEVLNSMCVTWTSYEMLIANVSQQLPQYAGAAFDTSKAVTSDKFITVVMDSDSIDFSGGTVANGETVHLSGIWITHTGGAGDVFYLKEMPVPEPMTLGLLALGGLGVLGRRFRR